MTIEELLLRVRRNLVFQKAVNPQAPDPDRVVNGLRALFDRHPPVPKAGGYDIAAAINGAAEYGLDPQRLAEIFKTVD